MASIAIGRRRSADIPIVIVGLAAVVAGAMLLPVAYLVIRAGDAGTISDELSSQSTREAIANSIALAAAVTAGGVAISLPLAWLTARTDLPLRSLWSILFALPLAIPSYVGGFALVSALGPSGLVQDWLEPLGVERLPSIYGFGGAWLALTLFTFPYVFLPLRVALRGVDRSMEEAARGLGASKLKTFTRVTLPQLRPAIAAGALLVALYTLSDFGAVSILRFDSLTRVIYVRYTSSFDRSSAAALALILVVLALVVVSIEGATRGRARYDVSTTGRKQPVVRLGAWRWPAVVLCSLVALVSLVLPLSVIVYWLARGLHAGEPVNFVREAGFNSLYGSGLAALVAVAASVPVAILTVRHPGWLSGIFEKITYSGFALPGISVALALVFFAANYTPAIYQTLALLVFAYCVRFLPEAYGPARAALLRVHPDTERAARGLGRSKAYVFARITLPQMATGMSAGAMLVFLTAMKELPATLILSPIGFDTLATQIWTSTREGFYTRAALPALVLVALSAAPLLVSTMREERRR